MTQSSRCQPSHRWLTLTILSISLLTVMAGAAVAPALGAVRAYFADTPPILIQLIVSMPALFIILTNLFFSQLCRLMRSRTIALLGLALYVCAGSGAFFCIHIGVLLASRAVLGVAVGMLLPLSTGLLTYYFPPERMAHLMGLSAFMNQMGGVIATMLAGLLCTISWNCAFLIYLGGLVAMGLVLLFLPNETLPQRPKKLSLWATLRKFHPSVAGMLLLMLIFFIFPTHFAITGLSMGLSQQMTTLLMVGLDLIAALGGLAFGKLMAWLPRSMKYVAPACLLAGMMCLAFASNVTALVAGCVLIGVATGLGVPYLNTIASIKGGKESTTTVMPLLAAALNGGQFLSPLLVTPCAHLFFGADDPQGAYKVGIGVAVLYLLQTITTRHRQMLPPRKR